ncbi:MAG: hypothetical protein QF852_02755, partial [Candidatus Marinimicrobia bacterium]|nr:hypothetical protein [Candidatus Neomarinimicrobiota bacterium]
LSTPYGKASVGGELLFDERYPERSTIRKFNLTVQNLSEELQEVLEEWELETGNSLPRKGRSIEINITGTLGEPLMDGKPLIESSYYYEAAEKEKAMGLLDDLEQAIRDRDDVWAEEISEELEKIDIESLSEEDQKEIMEKSLKIMDEAMKDAERMMDKY